MPADGSEAAVDCLQHCRGRAPRHDGPMTTTPPLSSAASLLLDADPARGLPAPVRALAERYDSEGVLSSGTSAPELPGFGMGSHVGAARVQLMLDRVTAVVRAGLGRDVAVAVLLGECARLMRDGHREHSDTVVRETVVAELEAVFTEHDLAPLLEQEVAEADLLVSAAAMDAARSAATAHASALTELERACALLDVEAAGVRPEGRLGTSFIRSIVAGRTYESLLLEQEQAYG